MRVLFPRATSQVAMLAWIFGDCREGQIPPLLAAGSLISQEIVSCEIKTLRRNRTACVRNLFLAGAVVKMDNDIRRQ